jgi:peptidoglycan/LPS O-acetylase OafA/YrhL
VLFLIGCVMCLPPCTSIWRVLGLWPNFFAGMAAWWAARHGGKALGYGALAVLLIASVAWPAYGGMGRIVAVVTGWVLALAYRRESHSPRTRLMRFFVWMGGLSYSLYLVHIPLMSPFVHLVGRWIPTVSPWFVAVWASAIAFAIAGAKCLNYFVEAPIEVWRKRVI